MDLTVLYIIMAVVIVVGITALIVELRRRQIVTKDDLLLVSQLFNLSAEIISEMNLKNEPKISQISQIVVSALKFATDNIDGKTKDEIIKSATDEAYSICSQIGIELTDSRKNIIEQLIQIGIVSIVKLPDIEPQPETNIIQETKTEDIVPTGLITPENNIDSVTPAPEVPAVVEKAVDINVESCSEEVKTENK